MSIPYNKNQQRKEFVFGILMVIIAIPLIWSEPGNPLRYYPVVFGLLLIGSYFFKQKYPYLKIEGDVLTVYKIRRKSLKLSEVNKIKKFAGEFTLCTSEDKIKIYSELIDRNSKAELNELIDSLDPLAERNSYKRISVNNS